MPTMSKDSIQVGIKLRPLLPKEKESQICWHVTENTISCAQNESSYRFDHVFDQEACNALIFEKMAKHIVHSAVKGFNGTIFAYGQTSSGKTYTMMGGKDDPGVMVLAAKELFAEIERASAQRQFLLRVGFIEIYNEKINDLLNKSNQDLKLFECGTGNVNVNCQEICVTSEEQLLQVLDTGTKKRTVGETNMNEVSSRSHSILRLTIESRDVSVDEDGEITQGLLHLVDLAGSERADQTGARGTRLMEGSHINKSLLSLSTVIKRLSENSDDGKFINFRDSKLTRILQASLGGNAFTSIICTVKPNAIEETQSTLNFATRAKSIKNKPIVNEVVTDAAAMKRLEREIRELKHELAEIQNKAASEIKVLQMKHLLSTKEHHLINSSSLHRSRSRKNNRRNTWCPDIANNTIMLSPLPEHKQLNANESNKAKNLFMTPQITVREYVADTRPPSSMEFVIEEEEFLPAEQFDFKQQPTTPVKKIAPMVSTSPATPNKSAYIRMIEEELRQLEEFTNLEKQVGVEHDVYKSLKESIDSLCLRNSELEKEHIDYLFMKDELACTKEDYDNVKKCCENLEAQVTELTQSRAETVKQLEIYKSKNIELESYQAQFVELTNFKSESVKKLEAYELKICDLEKLIKNLEIENRNAVELQFEFDRHQKKSKLREDDLIQALEEKEEQLLKINKQLKLLQDERTVELMQISHCIVGGGAGGDNEHNAMAKAMMPDVEKTCRKCENLQSVLEEKKKISLAFENLTTQYEELQLSYKKALQQVQTTQEQLAELEENFDKQPAATLEALKECDELREEIIVLRQKLEHVKFAFDEVQRERDEKNENCIKLELELQLAQESFVGLQNKYQHLECNWKNQENELINIRRDYASLETKYQHLQKSYEDLKACETKCVDDCQRLQRDNDELQQQIKALKMRIEQMQQKLNDRLNETPTKSNSISNQNEQQEIKELQMKCAQFQQENEELSMNILDHVEENEDLMRKYKNLEVDYEKLQFELLAMEQRTTTQPSPSPPKATINLNGNSDATFMEACSNLEAKLANAETQQADWLKEKLAFEEEIQNLQLKVFESANENLKLQAIITDMGSQKESLLKNTEQTILLLREEVLRLSKELLEKSTVLESCLENCSFAEYLNQHKIDRSHLSSFNELLQERIAASSQLELSTNGMDLANVSLETWLKPLPKPALRKSVPAIKIEEKFDHIEESMQHETTSISMKKESIKIENQEISMTNDNLELGNELSAMSSSQVSRRISFGNKTLCQQENDVVAFSPRTPGVENGLQNATQFIKSLEAKLEQKEELCRNLQLELLEIKTQTENGFRENLRAYNEQWEQNRMEYELKIQQLKEALERADEKLAINDEEKYELLKDISLSLAFEKNCSTPTKSTNSASPQKGDTQNLSDSYLKDKQELREERSRLYDECNAETDEVFKIVQELKTKNNTLSTALSEKTKQFEGLEEKLKASETIYENAISKLQADYEALKLDVMLKLTEKDALERNRKLENLNAEFKKRVGNDDEEDEILKEAFKINTSIQNCLQNRDCEILKLEAIYKKVSNISQCLQADGDLLRKTREKLTNDLENVDELESYIEKYAAELDKKMFKLEVLNEQHKERQLENEMEKISKLEATLACKQIENKQRETALKLEMEMLVKANELLKQNQIKINEQKSQMQQQNEAQMVNLAEYQTKLKTLEETIRRLKQMHEHTKSAIELENEKLKTELEASRLAYEEAREKAAICNLKSESLSQELHSFKLQVEQLTKTNNEYEMLESEYERVQNVKNDLQQELQALQNDKQANNKVVEQLRNELKLQANKAENLQQELVDLQAKYSDEKAKYARELCELQSKIKELQMKFDELKIKNAQLEQASIEQKQKIKMLEVANDVQLKQRSQIDALDAENNDLKNRLQELQTSSERKHHELDQQLQQRNEDNEKLKELLDTKIEEFKAKITDLERTNSCLHEQNKKLSERLDELTETAKIQVEAAAAAASTADSSLELSSSSNTSLHLQPAVKLLTTSVTNGDNMTAVKKKEQRNRRLSQHDENRRQSAKFTPPTVLNDVATMTDEQEDFGECEALSKQLKKIQKELYIKNCQVTAYTLELKNHPLKLEKENLIKRIQEEQQKYSQMSAKYKSKIEELATKITMLNDKEKNTNQARKIVQTNQESQTESELEAVLQKLQVKYEDLKKICRHRYTVIKEHETAIKDLQQKLNEKENVNTNQIRVANNATTMQQQFSSSSKIHR